MQMQGKGAAVDHFIKLWFEKESNRLKDSIAEHIVYGWEDPPKTVPIFEESHEHIYNGYQREYTSNDLPNEEPTEE